MGALTAWQALVDVAKLQPGQTVLIHGGSGGVGSFAVQIAKARGARVIATASTGNQDLLKQLGADVAVDYTKTKFEDVAKDVDAVLDPVGKETLARSYGVVKKGGIVMSLVARPDPTEIKNHGIRGAGISVHPDTEDLAEIAQLIDAGKIKPIVTQVLPLSEAVKRNNRPRRIIRAEKLCCGSRTSRKDKLPFCYCRIAITRREELSRQSPGNQSAEG